MIVRHHFRRVNLITARNIPEQKQLLLQMQQFDWRCKFRVESHSRARYEVPTISSFLFLREISLVERRNSIPRWWTRPGTTTLSSQTSLLFSDHFIIFFSCSLLLFRIRAEVADITVTIFLFLLIRMNYMNNMNTMKNELGLIICNIQLKILIYINSEARNNWFILWTFTYNMIRHYKETNDFIQRMYSYILFDIWHGIR
jgi:hypothetical protein